MTALASLRPGVATSAAAHREHTRSAKKATHERIVMEALAAHPDSTAEELQRGFLRRASQYTDGLTAERRAVCRLSTDVVEVRRRLSGLAFKGLAYQSGIAGRPRATKRVVTWRLVQAGQGTLPW